MNSKKRAACFISAGVLCSLLLISCEGSKEGSNKIEGVHLTKGAVVELTDGEYKNFNIEDGKYKKVDSDETVRIYDNQSGNYIYEKDGKNYLFYNGEQKELTDIKQGDIGLKMSNKGEYLSYFTNNEGLQLKVLECKTMKNKSIDSKVYISGSYLDWLESNTLVYYGVSQEGVNGIFTYDLDSDSEKLLYEIKEGIVEYLKVVNKDVLIVEQTFNNKKNIKAVNKDGSSIEIYSSDNFTVSDAEYIDGSYYFLGRFGNDVNSIYKVNTDGKLKRMVFDFPKGINADKGLALDDDGDLLFVGYTSSKMDEDVYKLSKDGSISLFDSDSKEYNFVR